MYNLENIFKKGEKFVYKNRGLLTTIGAVVGVGITIYFTAKATVKIEHVLNEVHTPEECKTVRKTVVKHALKPAAAAALTIFCIVLTYRFGKAAEAGFMSALAGAEALRRSYREHVLDSEKFSPEEEQKIFEESIADDKYTDAKPLPTKEDYNDYILYKEELTGEYFYAKPEDILVAELKLNRNISIGEYESFWFWLQCLTENDTFKCYKKGALTAGWCSKGWGSEEKYGYSYVDICQKKMTDEETGREYTLLYYPFPPHADYEDVDLCDDRDYIIGRILASR